MKLYSFSRCKVCNMRGQQAGDNLWRYGVCEDCETYNPSESVDKQLFQERLSECCAMNCVVFNEITGRWDFAQNPTPVINKADKSWRAN